MTSAKIAEVTFFDYWGKETSQGAPQELFFIKELHNITRLTLKDPAKCFYGVGTDAFVTAQTCQLAGADMIYFDQGILGYSLFLHDLPKLIIRNHNASPTFYLHSNRSRCTIILASIG